MKEQRREDSEMDDFRQIADNYETTVDETMKEVEGAWFRYIQHQVGPVNKRRREALITILRNISKWREMASHSEVVLGSGSMIEHKPLHHLINVIDWSNPTRLDIAILSRELVLLIKRVSDQINSAANESIDQDSEMEEILIAKGFDPNEDDTADNAAIELEITHLENGDNEAEDSV